MEEKQMEQEQKPLSIDELNRLQGSYNEVVKQNKNLQTKLNSLRQNFDELSAGVLMIAEILNLDIEKDAKTRDIISEIAAFLEENISTKEVEEV